MTVNSQSQLHHTLITIDSEKTRDLDDAISIIKNEDGTHLIRVVISNPVPFIKPGSIEDLAALNLGASIYRRDFVAYRMIDAKISEDQASLVVGKPRQAIVFEMTLSQDLDVTEFIASVQEITVDHRLSYNQIRGILGDTSHPAHTVLSHASTLSQSLLAKRRSRGAMALFDMHQLLMTNEDGVLTQVESAEVMIGNIIVQEMMILTNSQVGLYMLKNEVPAVFRNHKRQASAPSSTELASTVQSWIEGRALDTAAVQTQFNSVVGRATYSAHVGGHYGLNLPVYLHVTSPLRRYADLMNLRQLCAHLSGQPLTYANADLIQVFAEQLNTNIETHKLARGEEFKTALNNTVQRQLAMNHLTTLAEHEIEAAIKMVGQANEMPEPLANEIVRRISSNLLGMSATTRLVFKTPIEILNVEIREALSTWMIDEPSRAPMLCNAGAQIDMIKFESPNVADKDGVFTAKVKITQPDNTDWVDEAQASRKALAYQMALAKAMSRLLGVKPAEVSDTDLDAKSSHTGDSGAIARDPNEGNPKGALIEWCQKAKIALPEYNHSSEGPSHCPSFSVVASCRVGDQLFEARADEASSKKQAEALASRDLMDQIMKRSDLTKMVDNSPAPAENSDNPISALQERAQKEAAGLPSYDFSNLPGHPPEFECIVKVEIAGRVLKGSGRGSSKQSAKIMAASDALSNIAMS